ncbi:F-box/LRR-repeat protein 7-like [Schistocerca serialis cubense]|uniref:F-box/LRR-repeat protein 7-like n=1 Tax=Schistocerca serialis cubense TaxID=2023355 RepID=UPI00214EAFF1|nr:F-box/LRR-repeat protein 7-like [Schistocerca serialis cubense]XP_049941466.1 F-box/LRR-repeat protein 7-like [Schistocerca serialis cubense]
MSNVTAHINNFPDEILLHIFNYLPTPDLLVCVTKVCTRWNAFAYDRKLWNRRMVDLPEDTSVQALVECFPKCTSVSMELNSASWPGQAMFDGKHLHAFMQTRDCFHSFLTTIIKNGDDITDISVCGINEDVEEVLTVIAHLPNLQTLLINGSFFADNSGIRHIGDNCPHLRKVDTGEITFAEEEVEYFIRKKKHQLTHIGLALQTAEGSSLLPFLGLCGDTLISLDIYGIAGFYITVVDDVTVFSALKKLEHLRFHNYIKFGSDVLVNAFTSSWFLNLRTLVIDTATYVDDEVMAAISLNCPLLNELQINYSQIKGEGLKYLHCLRNLQKLDLSLSQLLKSLGTLSQCVQLRKLSLESCARVHSREIADAVPHIHELRVLDLSQCGASLLRLRELPQHLPFLRTLVLYGADINVEQLQAMRHCAPHINVVI